MEFLSVTLCFSLSIGNEPIKRRRHSNGWRTRQPAGVVELVDTLGLGPSG
jgi:hypothetical protein